VNSLPIDERLGDVVAALKSSSNLVLEAPPGAGKTTRVPPALEKCSCWSPGGLPHAWRRGA
jgi:HrpA-like RNA helicase